MSKTIIFLVISYLVNFYRHLAIFFWSHWSFLPHNHVARRAAAAAMYAKAIDASPSLSEHETERRREMVSG